MYYSSLIYYILQLLSARYDARLLKKNLEWSLVFFKHFHRWKASAVLWLESFCFSLSPSFPHFRGKPERWKRELSNWKDKGLHRVSNFLSQFIRMAWKRDGNIISGYFCFLIILKSFYLIWFLWWKYGNIFFSKERKEEKNSKGCFKRQESEWK